MARIADFVLHSIRGRLIVGVLLLHAVLMGMVVIDMMGRQKEFMEHQLAGKGLAMVEALAFNAATWMLSNDLTGLDELTDALKRGPDLSLALILDPRGKVRAGTDDALFNLTLDDSETVRLIDLQKATGSAKAVYRWHDGVVDCLAPIVAGKTIIGHARVVLSAASVNAELDQVLLKGAIYTLFAIIVGGLTAWGLVRTMTSRLAQLSHAADAIAAGDLGVSLPQDQSGRDEVARLIRDFNGMARALERDHVAQAALMRRLDAANDDLVRLTEVAAHHLQEPVRRLVIYSQRLRTLVSNQAPPETVFSSLDQIEGDGRYLRSLLRDIQDYLAAVHTVPSDVIADAQAAAEYACQSLERKIRDAHAEVSIAPLPPAAIDGKQLIQVFSQLIDNGLKYCRPGVPPRITIDAEDCGGMVRFLIADNGIGVPANLRDRVFKVFERLHLRTDYPGTGIGLAIVRRIIENCGGKVWLDESAAGGTLVVIQLRSGAFGPGAVTS
jgi:signal transduction histidine kinase